MKFAVAVCCLFANENQIFFVEAANEVEAVKEAFRLKSKPEYKADNELWLAEFSTDLEQVLQFCFDTENCVAVQRIFWEGK